MIDLLDSPEEKKSIRLNYRPLFIWAFFIVMGILFKIQHWPGSAPIILLSTAGIASYSISKVLFIYKTENIPFIILSIISICWTGILLFQVFFNYGSLFYNLNGLAFYIGCFIILFIIYSAINIFKLKKLNH